MKNKTKYLVAILLMLVSFLLIGATNVNAKTVTVETEQELINASKGIDSEINEIKLAKDITLTKFLNFYVVNDITLDLSGQTLDIGFNGLSFSYGQSDYDESNSRYNVRLLRENFNATGLCENTLGGVTLYKQDYTNIDSLYITNGQSYEPLLLGQNVMLLTNPVNTDCIYRSVMYNN